MAKGIPYGGNTILSHPIVVETILPFILVFTIVFAILQKSGILGKDKKQVDAIVALVVGLLVISFGLAKGIILQLTVFLAVALVVILVLMLLIGSFTEQGKFFDEANFPKALRTALLLVSIISVVLVVAYVTGFWTYLYNLLFFGSIQGSSTLLNIIFIIIIIAVVAFVIRGASSSHK